MSENTENKANENKYPWLNPIGSAGDALMLSGILKLINDKDPEKKYNIVRRSKYQTIFKKHPAVVEIGHPSKTDEIIEIDFWFDGELNNRTAYQTLASKLGLEIPIEEKLFIAESKRTNLLLESIPWKQKNIVISTTSPSPRKMMNLMYWLQLVEMLKNENFFVVQVGDERDIYIKGTYSLLGLTDTRQLISVVEKADAVVTLDNFVRHASKLTETPTTVIWGPTRADKYGYKTQTNIHGEIEHCNLKNECLGYNFAKNYNKPCPLQRNEHCMNKINIQNVFNSVINLIN